jgi:hypothetical protein
MALMAGAPSIPFAGFALYAQDPNAKLLFWVLASVSVVLSAYFMWRRERLRVIRLDQELTEERLINMPDLHGAVEQTHVAPNPAGGAFIVVNVSIRNTRAPSIVDRYEMVVIIDNRRWPVDLHATSTLNFVGNDGVSITIHGSDFIFEKTVSPIPSGGMVRGYLLGTVANVTKDQVFAPGTVIEVSFEDVRAKRYSLSHLLKGRKDPFKYYPDGTGGPRVERTR